MAAKDIVKYQMKKGETLNPKGRPKLPDIKETLAIIWSEEKNDKNALQAVFEALRAKAARGDVRAAELMLKYSYKQVTNQVDITTNGKDINIPIIAWDKTDGSQD